MNPNEKYWLSLYSSSNNELLIEPSNFAVFSMEYLQSLPDNSSIKNFLDVGCGNGRDSYFFASKGFKVTGIDPASKIETNKFQFVKKSIFDFELSGFDVLYFRFIIHTLTEFECDKLFDKLAFLHKKTLIFFETRSLSLISNEEKLETFFKSPSGSEHFRMLYSKDYMDKKISKKFTILNSFDCADVAKFKSENPFCLRYILQPK